jgi:hypothetical protein
MHNQNHRADAVAGLRALADFLEACHDAELNEASRIDVTRCVLDADPHMARAKFEDAKELMYNISGAADADFSEYRRGHNGNRHHVANLEFGNGTVAYQVTWIENTGDTEDE